MPVPLENVDDLAHYMQARSRLTAENASLRATGELVQAFCADDQVPAVHGTYAQGYQAARRDILRVLGREVR